MHLRWCKKCCVKACVFSGCFLKLQICCCTLLTDSFQLRETSHRDFFSIRVVRGLLQDEHPICPRLCTFTLHPQFSTLWIVAVTRHKSVCKSAKADLATLAAIILPEEGTRFAAPPSDHRCSYWKKEKDGGQGDKFLFGFLSQQASSHVLRSPKTGK